jgi:hypothetical protein
MLKETTAPFKAFNSKTELCRAVAYPGILFRGDSTNSVERGQREQGI